MIFKVAVDEDSKGNVTWRDPYGPAIRNRLRVDLNLADVPDKAKARDNLGITGMMDALKNELKAYVDQVDADNKTWTLNQLTKYDNEIQDLKDRVYKLETTVSSLQGMITNVGIGSHQEIQDLKRLIEEVRQECTEVIDIWAQPVSLSGGGTQFYIKFKHGKTGKTFIIQGGHMLVTWNSEGYAEIPFHISFSTGFCGQWMDAPHYMEGNGYGGNIGYDDNLSHASIRFGRCIDGENTNVHEKTPAHISWIAIGV